MKAFELRASLLRVKFGLSYLLQVKFFGNWTILSFNSLLIKKMLPDLTNVSVSPYVYMIVVNTTNYIYYSNSTLHRRIFLTDLQIMIA